MNMARVKKVLVALVAFLVVIQIFQPARTNPPAVPSRSLTAHVRVPEDVYSSLIRSCGDCHSNQTRWPWYSRVAPLSWVITDDVNEGRRHMNFEDWEALAGPQTGARPPGRDLRGNQEKGDAALFISHGAWGYCN